MQSEKLSSRLKKYILATVIGNGLEWYDFVIFGYFSPIFSTQFFPQESKYAALINIFIIFAVGLLSRPIGAYVFGKIADQQGRKKALLLSVALMAISTSLIGLLPTYYTIGIYAPLLLTALRICQGISMGGEFTSSLTFTIEHSPSSRRGFVGAWVYFGGFLGSALGAIVGAITTVSLTAQELESWGWRIPFFLGFGIAILGFYLRKKVEETPAFIELKKSQNIAKYPFRTVLKENLKEVLLIIGIILPNTVWIYLLFVFLPTYLTQIVHWDFAISLAVNLIPLSVLMILLPLTGYLSDLWGRKKIIITGQILSLVLAPIAFQSISSSSFYDLVFLQILLSLALALSYGPTAALLAEMFPVRLRNTGLSIAYHVSTGVFGGMTPLILTTLISYTENMIWPTIWVCFTVIIGLIAMIKVKDINQKQASLC